jgi:hypothetical protein
MKAEPVLAVTKYIPRPEKIPEGKSFGSAKVRFAQDDSQF